MFFSPPRTEGLSPADKIREASLLVRASYANLLAIPRTFIDVDEAIDAVHLARAFHWLVDQSERGVESVSESQEAFAAGFAMMHRSMEGFQFPSAWQRRLNDLSLPSYHGSAASWLRNAVLCLQWILLDQAGEPFRAPYDGIDRGELLDSWGRNRDRILDWAKALDDAPKDALVLLSIESVHALLTFEQLPAAGKSAIGAEEYELGEIDRRYSPPPCEKCGGDTKVGWKKRAGDFITRKVVCKASGCAFERKIICRGS